VFQAEDGIRVFHVTGVQTCALPICPHLHTSRQPRGDGAAGRGPQWRRGKAPQTVARAMIPGVSLHSLLCTIVARSGLSAVLVLLLLTGRIAVVPSRAAPVLMLPTANHALFEPDGESRFFAPTPGRSWTAGRFGC